MAAATCWRCQAEVKRDGAYCPVCGAAVRPGEAGGGAEWQSRIEGEPKGRRTWVTVVWVVLSFIAFPVSAGIGVLFGPAFVARMNRRLRRHVGERIASPVLGGERFTATREGEEIRRKLEKLARPGLLGYAWIMQYLLLAAAGLVLFVGAGQAPSHIAYDRALERILEVSYTYSYVPIHSKDQFEWLVDRYGARHSDVSYVTVVERGLGIKGTLLTTGLPYRDGSNYDDEPVYEFVDAFKQVRRASSIQMRWADSEVYGAVFWTIGALYLLSLAGMHFLYWLKYMRHRTTEVLAAAYARGDVKFHDEVMAQAQGQNHGLMFGAIALSLLQLHLIVFPWMGPMAMRMHEAWEKRVGVGPALGIR